jgi:radical SAM superfamily enzyme YgiQ (UPF0313 family)
VKVALLYPPPWKIPLEGSAQDYGVDGPPPEYEPGDLDADFYQVPYGLLQLGAEAMRAGHQVKLLNLSSFAWSKVEEVLDALQADVYALSCWTANRRGVALVSTAVKMRQPDARVIVGGPHATPLAKELLAHHGAIDVISKGESDITFLEVLDAISAGRPLAGIAGTVARDGDEIVAGPKRESIKELDDLAPVHAYFDTHIIMTSRGCPWACTFCGAETSWGRGFRSHSNEYVLDELERSVSRLPVKMVQVKDDTFTTNKKRVLELCRSIRERKLSFFWSCDTRVDLLSEELLREMRLAGCQRLSLGVESGSQRILDAIDKKITVQEIIASTELAKKVGIKVRYYMMLGNRGETAESFRETLAFLDRARPHEYIFSCLSIYPGTRDFYEAEKGGWLDREVYFGGPFQELKTPFDASDADAALMNEWFSTNYGLRTMHEPSAAEYRAVLELLGDYHGAHMDLGGALIKDGDLDGAEHHVKRAMDLGYPCPGLALNALGVIAARRRDFDSMKDLFMKAAKTDPQHFVLIRNVNAARAWFAEGGPEKGTELSLEARHDFQLLERTMQPTLPGPLPADFAVWSEPLKAEPGAHFVKTPDLEGSTHELGPRNRLKVVS